jgi:ParB-like chromosome segregation protein Spo0J
MGWRDVKNTIALPIAKIVVGERHRARDQGKVDALAESINTLGLQHAITVYADGGVFRLVAGEHRLEAVKKNSAGVPSRLSRSPMRTVSFGR